MAGAYLPAFQKRLPSLMHTHTHTKYMKTNAQTHDYTHKINCIPMKDKHTTLITTRVTAVIYGHFVLRKKGLTQSSALSAPRSWNVH